MRQKFFISIKKEDKGLTFLIPANFTDDPTMPSSSPQQILLYLYFFLKKERVSAIFKLLAKHLSIVQIIALWKVDVTPNSLCQLGVEGVKIQHNWEPLNWRTLMYIMKYITRTWPRVQLL